MLKNETELLILSVNSYNANNKKSTLTFYSGRRSKRRTSIDAANVVPSDKHRTKRRTS
jgi:hypothetical protein